jgi:4,5-dihydroxyphthalate decarboxylase
VPNVKLTLAMNPYDRIQPLINGEVKPVGVDLEYVGFPGGVDVFYDQLKFNRYDVAEMSFSSTLKARAHGWPYRILPVFHNRQFAYTRVLIRHSSGIRQDHPEDLIGKRVGVAEYQQTAALWARGVLQQEFGIRPQDMIWFMERPEGFSHGGASSFNPPPGLQFSYTQTDLGTMFLRGDLDAAFTYIVSGSMDRKKADLSTNPDYGTLFADPETEGFRYFRKHGVYPPQHTTVIRESVVREHPWIARSLMQAFEESKKIAIERLYKRAPSLIAFGGLTVERQRKVMGDDPYPYGLRANARAIDYVQTFSQEQGFTERKQPWPELFAEECLVMEELHAAEDVLGDVTVPAALAGV